MPGVVGGLSVELDAEPGTVMADRSPRHIQVNGEDPPGANQQVVGKDGIDPTDGLASAAEEPVASLDLDGGLALAHWTGVASATATLIAPGSRLISTGTVPNGSPSRWQRVVASPSIRTVRACTISTLGLRRCLAW